MVETHCHLWVVSLSFVVPFNRIQTRFLPSTCLLEPFGTHSSIFDSLINMRVHIPSNEWENRGQSMKSDCSAKRFLQTKGRRTNSLRFVTPSNQHHCFTFQNTIVFDSPIQMPTHPMIHSFIACRILENGVGMIHWDSLSFR